MAIRHGLSLSLSSALESYCPLYSTGNVANKDLFVAKATHISLREGTGGKKKLDSIYRPLFISAKYRSDEDVLVDGQERTMRRGQIR